LAPKAIKVLLQHQQQCVQQQRVEMAAALKGCEAVCEWLLCHLAWQWALRRFSAATVAV
jgi:hypothetical protein